MARIERVKPRKGDHIVDLADTMQRMQNVYEQTLLGLSPIERRLVDYSSDDEIDKHIEVPRRIPLEGVENLPRLPSTSDTDSNRSRSPLQEHKQRTHKTVPPGLSSDSESLSPGRKPSIRKSKRVALLSSSSGSSGSLKDFKDHKDIKKGTTTGSAKKSASTSKQPGKSKAIRSKTRRKPKQSRPSALIGGENHGLIRVPTYFTGSMAREILDASTPEDRRHSPIRGKISPNTAYVIDLSTDADLRLRDYPTDVEEARQWECVKVETRPNTKPKDERIIKVWEHHLKLGSDIRSNVRKNIYSYINNESLKAPEVWDPPLALVHYYGTGDFDATAPIPPHGNFGRRYKLTSSVIVGTNDHDLLVSKNYSASVPRSGTPPTMEVGKPGSSKPTSTGKKAPSADQSEKTGGTAIKRQQDEPDFATNVRKSDPEINKNVSESTKEMPAVNAVPAVASHRRGPPFRRSSRVARKVMRESISSGIKGTKGYEKLCLDSARKKGPKVEAPRDLKQMYNEEYSEKQRKGVEDDDLVDVFHLMVDTDYKVLTEMTIGKLRVVQQHQQLQEHFHRVLQDTKQLVFHYDTTFDMGPFYVSILSCKHPMLLTARREEPNIPVAVMYHTSQKEKLSHGEFFRQMKELFPAISSKNTIIVTDREKSIRKAIRDILPDVKLIPCYNHLRANVREWTRKRFSKKEALRYRKAVKKLLWCPTKDEFTELLQKYCPNDPRIADHLSDDEEDYSDEDAAADIEDSDEEVIMTGGNDEDYEDVTDGAFTDDDGIDQDDDEWDEKFKAYYFRFLHKDISENFRAQLSPLGIFVVNSGVTTNPAENVNSVIKPNLKGKQTLYELVTGFYKWQNKFLFDITRALEGKGGEYHRKDYSADVSKLIKDIEMVHHEDLFDPEDRMVALPKKYQDIRADVNFSVKEKLALGFHRQGGVKPLYYSDGRPTGLWSVQTLINDQVIVNPIRNRCSCRRNRCEHKIAVWMITGQLEDPKSLERLKKKSTTMTEVQKLANPKAAGKKRGQQRIPPEKDVPVPKSSRKKKTRKDRAMHKKQGEPLQKAEGKGPLVSAPQNPDKHKDISGHIENAPAMTTICKTAPVLDTIAVASKLSVDPSAVSEYQSRVSCSPCSSTLSPHPVQAAAVSPQAGSSTSTAAPYDKVNLPDVPTLTEQNKSKFVLFVRGHGLSLRSLKSIGVGLTTEDEEILKKDFAKEKKPWHRGWMNDDALFSYLYETTLYGNTRVLHPAEVACLLRRRTHRTTFMGFIQDPKVGEPTWQHTRHVLMPISIMDETHWVLMHADFDTTTVTCYDSLGKYLPDEIDQPKIKRLLNFVKILPEGTEWEFISGKCPKQRDSSSCGPYVCWFGDSIHNGRPLAQRPPPLFREHILTTIVGKCNLNVSLNRAMTKSKSAVETCTVCGKQDDSQGSSGSLSLVDWVQCEKCNAWCHMRCNKNVFSSADVRSMRYTCC